MSRIPLTADAVVALSPDDASTKAARGLVAPAKWPMLGASDAAVWGECQGSGSKPYQTQVDVSGAGPSLARWLGDIRKYFPRSVVPIMQPTPRST